MTRRIRAAVPPLVLDYGPQSGVGKMWHHVLRELGDEYDVRGQDPGSWRARLWRPDVWMHDGHQGPLRAREPVVAQLHEAAWSDPASRATLDPAWIERYEQSSREAAQRAIRIVTDSESSAEQIVQTSGVGRERIVVAPLGVDSSLFTPDATGGTDVVARGGGDAARPYVLFVSQLHPRKNIGVLRDAMSRLVASGFPHALVIVGGPAVDRADAAVVMRAATADLPGAEGRVVHLQGISDRDLAAVMAGAATFCLPSLMEGFGLTALEAMACGTPVVVSDRGALPEVVGEAGLVVPPSVEAITEALTTVLSDDHLAGRLGAAGRTRSLDFTWRATAEHWRRAIRDAVR